MERAVIVDAVRTASGKGKPGGALSGIHPADLLAEVLSALVERTGVDPALIDDVIIGCVTQAGEQAGNIARSATLAAGYPETVPGVTIDRQCGSSQQAVTFGAAGIAAGMYDVVVAGGVESMSRSPMGSAVRDADNRGPRMRARYPEGLTNQGVAAELIAAKWGLDRDELDAFSARSHRLATAAHERGDFAKEILPVRLADGTVHDRDETVRPSTTVAGLAGLEPSFQNDAFSERFPQISWSVTAGSSSPFTDAASGVLLMSESLAAKLGLRPRAAITHVALAGVDPIYMLTGPIPATEKILRKSGLGIDDIDAFEVNEAFAPIPLAWAAELGADADRLNPRGGAIALGHALGASGTRLLTTLVNQLESVVGRYGLQTMCEGGGLANALIVERL